MTIIKKIKANHGNQEALLELANKETLYKVANHFQVSPAKAAPKVAQRLFNAQSITIKGNYIAYGKKFSKRFDLTKQNDACQAIRMWETSARSFKTWKECGEDQYAYGDLLDADNTLSKHITIALELVRHTS
jgi:hypothetical protein